MTNQKQQIITLPEDNTYTVNKLRKVLGCNRLTAEKYIKKGNYKKTSVTYNGATYDAWIIAPVEIEKINGILHYTQGYRGATSETSTMKEVYTENDITPVTSDTSRELLRNITELNGRITSLENENRELSKEVKELTNENTILIRDKDTLNNKMLMIEDKSKTIEADNSRQRQEIQQLQKVVKNRNIALLVLGAVLLVIVAVVVTLSIVIK